MADILLINFQDNYFEESNITQCKIIAVSNVIQSIRNVYGEGDIMTIVKDNLFKNRQQFYQDEYVNTDMDVYSLLK